MAEKLLPCPFCNSTNIDPEGWKSSDGTSGPACDDCCGSANSIVEWNTRPREGSPPPAVEGGWRFKRGDYVRKVVGSKWNGRVVGFYTTELTQRGYAVESMYEIGSVQIYPEKALELFSVAPTPPAGEKS